MRLAALLHCLAWALFCFGAAAPLLAFAALGGLIHVGNWRPVFVLCLFWPRAALLLAAGVTDFSFLVGGFGPVGYFPKTLLQALSQVVSRRIRPWLAPRTPLNNNPRGRFSIRYL